MYFTDHNTYTRFDWRSVLLGHILERLFEWKNISKLVNDSFKAVAFTKGKIDNFLTRFWTIMFVRWDTSATSYVPFSWLCGS